MSIHDEKAVFMLRLYRECDNAGGVLDASSNHDECMAEKPHVFHLPVGVTG